MQSCNDEPAGVPESQRTGKSSDLDAKEAPAKISPVEQALNDDALSSTDEGDPPTEVNAHNVADEEAVDEELSTQQKILEEDIDEAELGKAQSEWSPVETDGAREKAKGAKDRGNGQFLSEQYFDAVESYTEALKMCPVKFPKDRAIVYQNRGACKARLDQNDLAIKDLTRAVELDPNYFKARLKRAQVYEKVDKLDEALKDYEHLLSMDPRHIESLEACRRLPERINERNEKLKTEMMSKLKDLGNLILRPFGMSTDNFRLQQDPNSGGYSISMQNNQS